MVKQELSSILSALFRAYRVSPDFEWNYDHRQNLLSQAA
jgi:hypothetical protein